MALHRFPLRWSPPVGAAEERAPLARASALAARWLPPGTLVIALFGLWEALVRAFRVPGWLLPPPSAIAEELLSSRALLARHAVVTLEEVLAGFVVALVAGVGLAIAIAYSRLVERSVYPFVIASQTIPIIAIAPLLLVWIGYDIRPKIVVVALISFFPIVVNMVDGLRSVDLDMVQMLRTLGASRWQVFRLLQLPSSLPYLFSGAKIAVAVAVIGAVIGEWVGASSGLGYLMVQAAPRFQTSLVFAAIAVLSVMGVALFGVVSVLERRVLHWRRSDGQERALGGG